MEFTAAMDFEIVIGGKINFEPDIYFKFFFQSLANLATCDKLTFPAGKGRIIYQKVKTDGWLVYFNSGKSLRGLAIRNSFANIDIWQSRYHDDIAIRCLVNFNLFLTLECEKFCYFPLEWLAFNLFYEN